MAKNKTNTNNKPSRKILEAKKIEPKWFIYQPQKGSYTAKFTPLADPTTRKDKQRKATCLQMFCDSASITLKFCLDPCMWKRYQKGVRVGCLYPEYFMQYFSSHNQAKFKKRVQYIRYNGNFITVECPSYEFNEFDHLPGLNCGRNYALVAHKITHYQTKFHDHLPYYWYEQKTFMYKMYFTRIAFICNPVTNMVTIDYEFTKELFDEETEQFVVL